VPVDFVNAAMDAVMDMVNGSMHPVNQGVKEAGIPARLDGAGICDGPKAENCGNENCGGGFHVSFSLVSAPCIGTRVKSGCRVVGFRAVFDF